MPRKKKEIIEGITCRSAHSRTHHHKADRFHFFTSKRAYYLQLCVFNVFFVLLFLYLFDFSVSFSAPQVQSPTVQEMRSKKDSARSKRSLCACLYAFILRRAYHSSPAVIFSNSGAVCMIPA